MTVEPTAGEAEPPAADPAPLRQSPQRLKVLLLSLAGSCVLAAASSQPSLAREADGLIAWQAIALRAVSLDSLPDEPRQRDAAHTDAVPQDAASRNDSGSMPVEPTARPSRADKLKHDTLQQTRVETPRSPHPKAPLRLSTEQRRLAAHIARTYRVPVTSIEPIIAHASRVGAEHQLEPNLLLAVMAVESSFNPMAESSAGAQGLMQVLTRVHRERFKPFGGVDAAWDPFANIIVGASILAEYVGRYGDIAGGLKAYVGAALHKTDRGYGSKVIAHRDAFDAVARGERGNVTTARTRPSGPSATALNGFDERTPTSLRAVGL